MKVVRLILGSTLLVAVSFGAYWAVCAQEGGPLWPAPPVLPPGPPVPALLNGQIKKPGWTGTATEDILPVGGVMPNPNFPTPALDAPKKDLNVPAPLPGMSQPKPLEVLFPLPKPVAPVIPEPTKVFIKDPPLPDHSKAEAKKDTQRPLIPPPLPDAKPNLLTPPPLAVPETNKETFALPLVVPETKKEIFTPPLAVPETKKEIFALPLVVPDTKNEHFTPPPIPEPQKAIVHPQSNPGTSDRMKSFVRIRPPGSDVPQPDGLTGPIRKREPIPVPYPLPPAQASTDLGSSNLLSIQTPSVTVEKRGAVRIRAGEAETYQFVVRNLGPVPAQLVRIEEELPASVRILSAEPMPAPDGSRLVWTLPMLNVNQEQVLRVVLKAGADAELGHRVNVSVSASNQSATALRPSVPAGTLPVRLTGPSQVSVGKTANFEIRVVNQTGQPLNSLVLHAVLPEGLSTPDGREIEGTVDGAFMPGEVKTLKMPAAAVKPGRYTVHIKVSTKTGMMATDSITIDIVADGVLLQQAPATKMLLGRNGDLRIDLTNHSGKPLRNVTITDRLPEGVEFIAASERGLYQANSRTVHWLIDQLPVGKSHTFFVRVNGHKAGQHNNVVAAKADGVTELQAPGVILMEGVADLTMRVVSRDNHLELGRETVYEVQVQNPGSLTASQVRLQVQFTPGLTPRSAEASARHTIDRQNVLFEPLDTLGPQGQAIFRVTALSQSVGDQRVRFTVVSDQVRTPIQREISTIVYRD